MSNTTRAALVVGGQVTNVIVAPLDGSYEAPAGHTAVVLEEDSLVSPGWTVVDGEFVPPAVTEPVGAALPTVLDLQAQIDALILDSLGM